MPRFVNGVTATQVVARTQRTASVLSWRRMALSLARIFVPMIGN